MGSACGLIFIKQEFFVAQHGDLVAEPHGVIAHFQDIHMKRRIGVYQTGLNATLVKEYRLKIQILGHAPEDGPGF